MDVTARFEVALECDQPGADRRRRGCAAGGDLPSARPRAGYGEEVAVGADHESIGLAAVRFVRIGYQERGWQRRRNGTWRSGFDGVDRRRPVGAREVTPVTQVHVHDAVRV